MHSWACMGVFELLIEGGVLISPFRRLAWKYPKVRNTHHPFIDVSLHLWAYSVMGPTTFSSIQDSKPNPLLSFPLGFKLVLRKNLSNLVPPGTKIGSVCVTEQRTELGSMRNLLF